MTYMNDTFDTLILSIPLILSILSAQSIKGIRKKYQEVGESIRIPAQSIKVSKVSRLSGDPASIVALLRESATI